MNYFADNLYTVIGFLFGLYLIYSGVNGLISGEIYIGGRGISSGATFFPPASTYASLLFILFGCFTVYWFARSIIDYKRKK
ncbi:MAG TPA: hypothetical protein DEP07_21560 [Brevibacillus sp.]|jgi:hypothetical protein|nr:hypothetical protein [Brevibacillus sp.]